MWSWTHRRSSEQKNKDQCTLSLQVHARILYITVSAKATQHISLWSSVSGGNRLGVSALTPSLLPVTPINWWLGIKPVKTQQHSEGASGISSTQRRRTPLHVRHVSQYASKESLKALGNAANSLRRALYVQHPPVSSSSSSDLMFGLYTHTQSRCFVWGAELKNK